MSEDGKRRVSEAQKGRKMSNEHKQKLININKFIKRSDTFKQNISNKNKGKKRPDVALYKAELNKKVIIQFDILGNYLKEWDSLKSCYEFFKDTEYQLRKSLKDFNNLFHGYKFKYKSDYE